ncbi:MAG: hypothetical protein LBN21_01235 [Treponema sp.]|nr:hypothetical protein [Treponema sp.]
MTNDRIPLHNDEAEQAVLGASLFDNDAIITAMQYLHINDFSSRANRLIFEAIIRLFNRGYRETCKKLYFLFWGIKALVIPLGKLTRCRASGYIAGAHGT